MRRVRGAAVLAMVAAAAAGCEARDPPARSRPDELVLVSIDERLGPSVTYTEDASVSIAAYAVVDGGFLIQMYDDSLQNPFRSGSIELFADPATVPGDTNGLMELRWWRGDPWFTTDVVPFHLTSAGRARGELVEGTFEAGVGLTWYTGSFRVTVE